MKPPPTAPATGDARAAPADPGTRTGSAASPVPTASAASASAPASASSATRSAPAAGTQPADTPQPGSAPHPRQAARALAAYLALAAVIVLSDQLTKVAVERAFSFAERLAVIPGWFDLTLVYNRGAAFSFLAGAGGWQRWFFTAVALGASVLIVWMLVRHAGQRLFCTGLALILGGAVGNVIDRVLRGQVVDFLLAHWHDRWYFPAFNVADAAITVGAALLILDELRRMARERRHASR